MRYPQLTSLILETDFLAPSRMRLGRISSASALMTSKDIPSTSGRHAWTTDKCKRHDRSACARPTSRRVAAECCAITACRKCPKKIRYVAKCWSSMNFLPSGLFRLHLQGATEESSRDEEDAEPAATRSDHGGRPTQRLRRAGIQQWCVIPT